MVNPNSKSWQAFFTELIDNDTLIIFAVVALALTQKVYVSEAITGLLAFLGAKVKK